MPIAAPANKQPDHLIATWESFNCSVNREVIGFHRCLIVDPDKTLLTAEFEYIRAFSNVNITLALYVRRGKSKMFRKTLVLRLNYCELSQNKIRNKIGNMAYKSVIKNSNYPRKCPVPKALYYFRDINLSDNIPPFLPPTSFKAEIYFFSIDIKIITVSLSGNFTRKQTNKYNFD
ncbi:uncharacterized protein LOC115565745 [Drosophila navojoa]|uniref:uncharacterized protein LOC115565745 n=1 Tax=Drosophila navojoa TaxID=7232 RepID=UPI0011BE55DA|nr:uncharacterized protein LOC115565745 [Drosophila navojoa]